MITNLHENPSDCKCQSDSKVQGTSRRPEKKRKEDQIEIAEIEEWEMKKYSIKKMRGVNRYLVCWKGFTKELVDEFEED